MGLASIEQAVTAIAAGLPVIVADSEDRENEGDIIISAQLASRDWIAWTVANTSGLLCAAMSNQVADRMQLPMMVQRNEDERQTAYTVTVDAAAGVTTGISAADRMTTLRVLADPLSTPKDVNRPGHILPLRAVDGGVRERPGHTEAAVELMRLAELEPVGVIAEIVAGDGEMMRLPELLQLGARENIPVITIADLIKYLQASDACEITQETATDAGQQNTREQQAGRVQLQADTLVPTKYGDFRMLGYLDARTGSEHVAVVKELAGNCGALADRPVALADPPLVRLHSECLTGEALGSLKCECGGQLDAALQQIAEQSGVVIYLREHEGRGIGLNNKLRAYALQEQGLDTVEANVELGLPVEARDYAVAAAILRDLQITELRLLTNNPDKERQLLAAGIKISERVPLIVDSPQQSDFYMRIKRDKMSHYLPADDSK